MKFVNKAINTNIKLNDKTQWGLCCFDEKYSEKRRWSRLRDWFGGKTNIKYINIKYEY